MVLKKLVKHHNSVRDKKELLSKVNHTAQAVEKLGRLSFEFFDD